MVESIDTSLTPLEQVVQLMRILRGPAGCPWDRGQNFADIAPYTIEEAYEVKDAIDRDDMPELRDELGDLLFQVVFHSEIAASKNAFTIDDVCTGLVEKMVRRHPHVFADGEAGDWEDVKASERSGRTLDGVALALPALLRAQKLQKRAARVGFDWPNVEGVEAKIVEELEEVRVADTPEGRREEIGDLLFSVVNYARHLGISAEDALRDANAKFEARFRYVEDDLGEAIKTVGLEALEASWTKAKAAQSPRENDG